ncbi:hypothetical protein [Rhodoligotrophos defluvii]|uniref:hypothetical protein n=1 Tax=Rhodoligotrophos defluvii TaxID=2561934 RepID=UPI0014858BDE|nr:hypothetical protein [Rhodoligotrophos defluvii]
MKASILTLALAVSAVAFAAGAQACTYKSVQTTSAPMTVAEVPPAAPAPAPSTKQ